MRAVPRRKGAYIVKKFYSWKKLCALLSAAVTAGALSGFGAGPVFAEQAQRFAAYPELRELYAEDFRIGVACEAISHWNNRLSEIGNADKEALILKEFNSITFGNELKPAYNMAYSSAEATETNLPFGHNRAAIEMLDWAKENGMPVRGHTLIWHSQCEDAVFCKGYKPVYQSDNKLDPACLVDAETMKLRMESYIHHVMEYMYANGYGDVIYAWDVVNEAIEPGANSRDMRESYWYQIIGEEFLFDAFQYAREAAEQYSVEYAGLYGIDPTDPEAVKAIQPKLFYNDYNEFQPRKRDAILRAVEPIAQAGYLDGIGMQGHLSDTTDIDSYITALKLFSAAGYEVQITELDVARSSSGEKAEYNQGQFYYALFRALLDAKKEGANLTGVTIWGLTDDNSWKKESSPLIFRGDLTAKPAFTGIVNAKTGEPMPQPEYEAPDFSDAFFTFDEAETDKSESGFWKRGGGNVAVQSEVTHSGNGALLDSGRTESWHGASFDVSRFAGQTISVHAWVKTEDSQVKLTADIDGTWPTVAAASSVGGDWVPIGGSYTIPSDLSGLSLYFETNGKADLYIDDVSVKLVGMNENFEAASHVMLPRGVGHIPQLAKTSQEAHSGRYALQVTRQAQEATVMLDVSKYTGRVVEICAFVKTDDDTIRMGVDGENLAAEVPAVKNDWTELRSVFPIPADRTSAQIFIETSGSADYYVDDISVRIGKASVDLEDGAMPFTTRWQGAGTLAVVEEDGNLCARLSNRAEAYYGISYDITPYLGMEVEVSFDVKSEDTEVKLSGEIDQLWPNYIVATVQPGAYTTVRGVIRLPKDLPALRVYIESNGKSDLYVDNFMVQRAPVES